jgi:hypothetical protein
VGATYANADFVPSPPGNSPECFRTYEAVIAGALPLLDGRPSDYVWHRAYHGVAGEGEGGGGGSEARAGLGGGLGLPGGPFPAPLGFVFDDLDERAEAREARDGAGFELVGYALVRRDSEARATDGADGGRGGGADGGRGGGGGGGGGEVRQSLEGPWRRLLEVARSMGAEERRLRRGLNARYYVSTVTAVRRQVQACLFEDVPS